MIHTYNTKKNRRDNVKDWGVENTIFYYSRQCEVFCNLIYNWLICKRGQQ